MVMKFWFKEKKTAEAAAYLLKLNGGMMDKLTLIRMLYMTDRTVLLECGWSITGDKMIAMDHGPALSQILNIINFGAKPDPCWAKYIISLQSDIISLKQDVNQEMDELSRYEIKVLSEIFDKFSDMDSYLLADYMRTLPEWYNPNGSILSIEYEELLRKNGISEEVINDIVDNAETIYSFQILFYNE